MLSSRTYKAYGIALLLLVLYTAAGVFFAAVCYPGTLAASTDEEPRTVVIRLNR